MVEAIPFFENLKMHLVDRLGTDADGCHIYIGLLLFMFAAVIFRKKGVRAWMLIPVFMLAIGGEIVDASNQIHALGYWEWDKSLHDVFNTIIIPVVLYLLLKLRILTGVEPETLAKQALD